MSEFICVIWFSSSCCIFYCRCLIYYIKLLEVRENYILDEIQVFHNDVSLEVSSLSLQPQPSQPHNICSSHTELLLNLQTCLVFSCQLVLACATRSQQITFSLMNSYELFKASPWDVLLGTLMLTVSQDFMGHTVIIPSLLLLLDNKILGDSVFVLIQCLAQDLAIEGVQ